MSNREAGKGCKPRPFSVTQDEYDNRWNAIFARHETNTEDPIDFPVEQEENKEETTRD